MLQALTVTRHTISYSLAQASCHQPVKELLGRPPGREPTPMDIYCDARSRTAQSKNAATVGAGKHDPLAIPQPNFRCSVKAAMDVPHVKQMLARTSRLGHLVRQRPAER